MKLWLILSTLSNLIKVILAFKHNVDETLMHSHSNESSGTALSAALNNLYTVQDGTEIFKSVENPRV